MVWAMLKLPGHLNRVVSGIFDENHDVLVILSKQCQFFRKVVGLFRNTNNDAPHLCATYVLFSRQKSVQFKSILKVL